MEDIYQQIEKCIAQGNNIVLTEILNKNRAIDLNNGSLYTLNPPLYRAAEFGFYDVCETLISYGADVNYTKDNIFYPLEGAASANNIDVAGLLLSHGANINGYHLVRISAIGAACTNGHYDMIKYLIDSGADINRVNIGLYMTPLDLAIMWNREHIFDLLIENGAVSNINHDYDWATESAGGISAHIDYYIGRVLPNRFNLQANGTFYRIAIVNKNSNVLLYSTGNYQYSNPSIEFIMVLPLGWNPYSETLPSGLPYKIMDWLSLCLQGGRRFFDGEFVSFDAIFDDFQSDYAGFYIIDYDYTKQDSQSENDSDSVTLFTLVPQKAKKNGQYEITPERLEKLKGGKWKSLEWKSIPIF